MTRDQDIERVLERWFTEGPTEMSGRLFNEVVDRIDHIPQRRLARLQTRLLAMNSTFRLAAAAVIVLVVAGLGAFALTRPPASGITPSPSPAAAVTPAPSFGALLPAALRATWVGATRTVPQVAAPIPRSVLSLSSTLSFITGQGAPILFSSVQQVASDTLAIRLSVSGNGCQAGDVGNYTFALSGGDGGGGLMSLHSVDDPCAARLAAISGDWYRSRCQDVNQWCLGDLAAGTYPSIFFNPWVTPDNWVSKVGALTYTVPAGWTSPEDCDGCFQLAKQGGPKDTGIYVFDDVVAHAQGATMCQALNEPGVGRTATDLATWLTTLPGLVTTTPQAVTIGGLDGYTLDVSVAPTWTQTCSFSNGVPIVSLWSDANPAETNGFDWGVGATGGMRIFLLDLGDGRTLLIDVEGAKADYASLLPDAMAVIQSFEFHR